LRFQRTRATERRDRRIHADLAQRLTARDHTFYADTPLDVGLAADTVYASDSSTIDLCLPACPWANLRTTRVQCDDHRGLVSLRRGHKERRRSPE
jgi:hypothetical protein